MAKLACALVDLILIGVFFGQTLKMAATLIISQDAEEAVVGIKDLLCCFFQVGVTQKNTSNNVERRLAKNRFHVFDHFLVTTRISEYGLSVVLRVIKVATVAREQSRNVD